MTDPLVPVVRCEPGVSLEGLAPGGIRILARVDQATGIIGKDIWITSGTDSHTTGQHPAGNALDLKTIRYDVPTTIRLFRFLADALGPRFTVLYECPVPPADGLLAKIATVNPHATGPHLHVQVKKGTVYPPPETESSYA